MKFLGEILGRPNNERAMILLVVGHPVTMQVPRAATVKKPSRLRLSSLSDHLGKLQLICSLILADYGMSA